MTAPPTWHWSYRKRVYDRRPTASGTYTVTVHRLASDLPNPLIPVFGRDDLVPWQRERVFRAGSRWTVYRYRRLQPHSAVVACMLFPVLDRMFDDWRMDEVRFDPFRQPTWTEAQVGDDVVLRTGFDDWAQRRHPRSRSMEQAQHAFALAFVRALTQPIREFDTVLADVATNPRAILHQMYLHGAISLEQIEAFDARAAERFATTRSQRRAS